MIGFFNSRLTMHFSTQFDAPGEHKLLVPGQAGQLEAVFSLPENSNSNCIAFLGHPHSLQGGSMSNKVVTTLARVFKELHIPSLRFNFRGVGQSEGSYDAGVGESEDMLALVKEWQRHNPQAKFIFAGFSFGSYVVYRVACQCAASMLLSIAPPVHHYNYQEYPNQPRLWLIVQGDEDEVVPTASVVDFANQQQPPLSLIQFPDTGHFFHGKLIELKHVLMEYLKAQIPLL